MIRSPRKRLLHEKIRVTLSHSKETTNGSHPYWRNSWPEDQLTWRGPHVYELPTVEVARVGRDAATESILELPER